MIHKQRVQPKPHILVLCHWDGWIEVYGIANVKICMVPEVPGPADTIDNIQGELLAEQYIEKTLPESYRRVFMPGLRADFAKIETVRPSDLARRQLMASLMRAS